MKVLITGGAGYIGSTVASAFLDAGDEVVVLDDLSRGAADFLRDRPAYLGDIADAALLERIFAEHGDIALTVHCAARTVVPESITDPLGYYEANVAKTIALLANLRRLGCSRLINSSSAAVYGRTDEWVVTEASPVRPDSPYGRSKLMVEQVLADACATGALDALSLRYFNPIGADPGYRTGPLRHTDEPVLSTLLEAWQHDRTFRIHGRDWDTADGTPVRDFVHVWDVALAHVAAAHHWPRVPGHHVINVGTGRGTTVAQLAAMAAAELPRPLRVGYDARRIGDVRGSCASVDKAAALLGWRAVLGVGDAVHSAVEWMQRNPVFVPTA